MHSCSQISTNSHTNDYHNNSFDQLNNAPYEIPIVQPNSTTGTTNNPQADCEITTSPTESLSSKD